MSIILKAEDIVKTYKTGSGDVPVLKGISCEFEAGLFYSITGRSGSGKTTLLHVLSGLDKPTSGKVVAFGDDIYALGDEKTAIFRRRTIGFVFQQYNLLDEYNAITNICMPLKLDGKKPDKALLDEITDELHISDKVKKYPSELSGGEQQRVAIARALIARPKIIFADEPTGNLDKKTGDDTMNLLRTCSAKYGQTLIVVTHNPEIADSADKKLIIEDGKLL